MQQLKRNSFSSLFSIVFKRHVSKVKTVKDKRGNLQPVRMICEYDWKECPIAVVSYIWSEIVTDVVDGITGETQLWRILAIMLLCSMLFRTVYCKMRWMNKSEHNFAKEHLIKVGFKMQDLELKINILTYKMQYGIWPLPHEISTPSLNDLRNVKLTLSNTSRQNMWTKHHLHGYISKCVKNLKDNKSMSKHLMTSEHMDLAHENFSPQLRNGNDDFQTLKSERNLKLLHKETDRNDYERLIKTAKECRNYMDEINASNKSLGLFETSSDISDLNSLKDIYESGENSHRFLIDPKKGQEIYKYKNGEDEAASESELNQTNQLPSMSNVKYKDLKFHAENQQYPLKNSNNRSRLLPPGLSITFLSDKFKTLSSSDKCVLAKCTREGRSKVSTNETLNKVKVKLESLPDMKHAVENSKSLNNIHRSLKNRKSSETDALIKSNGKINSRNRDQSNLNKLDELISSECDSSNGDNRAVFNSIPIQRGIEVIFAEKFPARHLKSYNEHKESQIYQSDKKYVESKPKTMSSCFEKIAKAKNIPSTNVSSVIAANTISSNMKISVESLQRNIPEEINKDSLILQTQKLSTRCGVARSLSKIKLKEENSSPESDSSTSIVIKSTSLRKNDLNSCRAFGLNVSAQKFFDSNKNALRRTEDVFDDNKEIENDINLELANEQDIISKHSISYVLSPQDRQLLHHTPMETDEDATLISQTSSQTELSKDSDTDDKSTTTLLQEALAFKKALLLQIHRESEKCDEKSSRNESSECESDDTTKSKTDNHFRSKLLDIISEEQSADSSTEKTSRTYILSRSINETNLCNERNKYLNRNNTVEDLKYDKLMQEVEFCGDSKSIVIASSSEYFSTNNITDNEHASGQNITYCIADGDGLRELKKSSMKHITEDNMNLSEDKNYQNDNIAKNFDVKLKNDKAKEQHEFFEKKSDTIISEESQDNLKKQKTISDENNVHSLQGGGETHAENSRMLNRLDEIVANTEDINKIEESIEERSKNSFAQSNARKSESKIKFYTSLSSIDSAKAISWNSISESSSNESIAQYVNTLTNLESKNTETVATQKLMMLRSTDFEGRNFTTVGEDLKHSFDPQIRKDPIVISLSEINVSESRDGVVEDILQTIAGSTMFELEKCKSKEQDLTIDNAFMGDHSEGLNLFSSHSTLNLDQEKLQRKQDIFSKLKTLDAFMKPLDISECNSEKNENEGDTSPLTDRTVIYSCNSNTTTVENIMGSNVSKDLTIKDYELNDAKAITGDIITNGCDIVKSDTILGVSISEDKLHEAKSQYLFLENQLNDSEKTEMKVKIIDGIQSIPSLTRILSTQYIEPDVPLGKEENEIDARNNCYSDKNSDISKSDKNLESKKVILNSKRNQLSKSSITNFSTDTSDSYFDLSNHDFAVSSIILTSQNSNFASNNKDYNAKSDTSSSYIDASDQCSKIPSNSSSTESRTLRINTNATEEIKTTNIETPMRDVTMLNYLDSKHESLTKTQLTPKCTTSLPSNDRKYQLNVEKKQFSAKSSPGLEDGQAVTKDQGCAQSSNRLNREALKCWSSLNFDKSDSKSKTISKSCIPILKSRIETPRRGKSMECKARSQSPVRRSNTPTIACREINCRTLGGSVTNENEKKFLQLANGSQKSLKKKHSYILPSKNSDTSEEYSNLKPGTVEKKESRIPQSVSSESSNTKEKSNLLGTSGHLTKECTVIYINIISDTDRNEAQAAEAKEILKYVNEEEPILSAKKLDSKCQSLSLRNIISDRSEERKYAMNVSGSTSESKLCKDSSECVKEGHKKGSKTIASSLRSGVNDSSYTNDSEEMNQSSENVKTTANKLLSTSTLQLSNTVKVERREIEVSAKPSVKNISTSVSDFPDHSREENRSVYNQKNEVFDVSKDYIQKEQILLSEMLTTDPNIYECKKPPRLYNKLGLCFQEQPDES